MARAVPGPSPSSQNLWMPVPPRRHSPAMMRGAPAGGGGRERLHDARNVPDLRVARADEEDGHVRLLSRDQLAQTQTKERLVALLRRGCRHRAERFEFRLGGREVARFVVAEAEVKLRLGLTRRRAALLGQHRSELLPRGGPVAFREPRLAHEHARSGYVPRRRVGRIEQALEFGAGVRVPLLHEQNVAGREPGVGAFAGRRCERHGTLELLFGFREVPGALQGESRVVRFLVLGRRRRSEKGETQRAKDDAMPRAQGTFSFHLTSSRSTGSRS